MNGSSNDGYDIYDDQVDINTTQDEEGDDYLEAIRETRKSSSNFLSVYEDDDDDNNNKDSQQIDKEKLKDVNYDNIKQQSSIQQESKSQTQSRPSNFHVNTANQKDLRIFRIEGLEWWTNEDEVSKIFNPHGRVFEIKFDEDKKNGKSNGIAYVYLDIDTSPEELVNKLNQEFKDDKIHVDLSNEEEIVKLKNYNKGRKERKEELAKLKQPNFNPEKSDQSKQSSYHSSSSTSTTTGGTSSGTSTGHFDDHHSYSSRKEYDKRRRDDYGDRYDRSYYYESSSSSSSSRRDADFDRKYRDSRRSRYDRGYRPY